MLEDLHKYVSDARKQGFSYDEIALKLESSGWNPFLVEHAISRHRGLEDQSAVHSSIWWVVGIFVIVVLVVYGAAHFGFGPTSETFCVEPGVFGLTKQTSFATCCEYGKLGSCSAGETYTLSDSAGKITFASNVHCATPKGDVIIRGDVVGRC